MKVTLQEKTGKVIKKDLDVGIPQNEATVADLSRAIYKAYPKWDVTRQRLSTSDGKTLEKGKSLQDCGVNDGDVIIFKDLGPQIGWTTVFLIEYLGPILIHAFFYYNQTLVYGSSAPMSKAQTFTFYCVVAHFLKREYETLFVHRFSNDTMPLRNLPKNCAHYWILGGLLVAYPVYRPGFVGPLALGEDLMYSVLGLYLYAEGSNLVTHSILANLRPVGSKARKIPYGYGFNLVSCPNYTYEILAWISVTLLCGSFGAAIFTAVGAIQMYLWAVKKHKRYIKDFGDEYPKNRKILIPFLL
ncbi:3-oxo-5-alpha-steroid 4-dehydrogenase-domain-containing protein [Obelidium mucronatum]|nr:3-oxo-5-alpha-steroid 4-dehydrogenase-domain-containing protein [Obelidium mucronatum]